MLRRHDIVVVLGLELQLCLNLMLKQRCKQSVEATGMACEGRARNRMLRKRWIVRNPVVREDDITQFVLARLFNTSWSFSVIRKKPDSVYIKQDKDTCALVSNRRTEGYPIVCVI